jgi:hypothetical protein
MTHIASIQQGSGKRQGQNYIYFFHWPGVKLEILLVKDRWQQSVTVFYNFIFLHITLEKIWVTKIQ